ncbi:hypothetical protein [Mameliella alba]|uniref:hypothetical protein n=1 Tax=Mameliella alba TaxID=561184 RepID=UPI000B537AD4|nr:hypothetical protein [Mameliella alba]OWV40408.1 hypothetical protein CDZ95_21510 [Mameliella alba]
MKPIVLICTLAVALGGCTEMQDFYDETSVVVVDGQEIMVRPLPGRTNSYHATANHPDGSALFTSKPLASVNNVRAIEQFTGCTVIRESIENREMHTFAAVHC